MAEVAVFRPRHDLDAEANVKLFIAFCRDEVRVFGADLPFDEMSWDLTAAIVVKGKGTKVSAVFSSWATVNAQIPQPMEEPFGSLAKSYVRLQQSLRPTKALTQRIAALRATCAARGETGDFFPWKIDASTLNRAAQIVKAHFAPTTAYRIGGQIEVLAKFMDDNRLAALPLRWRNSIARPSSNLDRVGKEFDDRRKDKLPSPFALDALARAYRAAESPVDRVLTSVAALMCSAPDRICEVLGARVDCGITQEKPDGTQAFGLRYWPAKGAAPMVKWMVSCMAEIAQEALTRITSHTNAAREVAAWYEGHPGKMFLPEHLSHFRGKAYLTLGEAGQAVFVEPVTDKSIRGWCKRNKVALQKIGETWYVPFADLERATVAMLPRFFPFVEADLDLKFSKALCVIRLNEFEGVKATYWGVIQTINAGAVARFLGSESEKGMRSVFDKMGFFEEDGSPIAIRSHQFRHYLDTLAVAGGMSELDIAKWSGRKDVGQNGTYNHVSDHDLQARLKDLRQVDPTHSVQVLAQKPLKLYSRNEFADLRLSAAHTTDFGFCEHDFVMAPCSLHRDCANCNEQVCIKGDEIGEANARSHYRETQILLTEAESAMEDGAYGASKWVRHQKMTSDRLGQLLQILDDPTVPLGAVIRLEHIQPASRLQQAKGMRDELGIEDEWPLLAWQVDAGTVHG